MSIYLIENVQLTRVAFNVNPQFRRSNYSTRNGVSTYIVMFTYTYINDTFWVQMVLWIAIFDICTIAKSLKWANNRFLCKYTNMQCLKLTPTIATILRRRFKFIKIQHSIQRLNTQKINNFVNRASIKIFPFLYNAIC